MVTPTQVPSLVNLSSSPLSILNQGSRKLWKPDSCLLAKQPYRMPKLKAASSSPTLWQPTPSTTHDSTASIWEEYSRSSIAMKALNPGTETVMKGYDKTHLENHMELCTELPDIMLDVKSYNHEENEMRFEGKLIPFKAFVGTKDEGTKDEATKDERTKDEATRDAARIVKSIVLSMLQILGYTVPRNLEIGPQILDLLWIDNKGIGRFFAPSRFSSGDPRRDLEFVSNLIMYCYNIGGQQFAIENGLSPAKFPKADLPPVPPGLEEFCRFLPTFDPTKHTAEIFFNPPLFWDSDRKELFLEHFHDYAFTFRSENKSLFNRMLKRKKKLIWMKTLPPGTAMEQFYIPRKSQYRSHVDVVRFYRNMRTHPEFQMYENWSMVDAVFILETIDSHMNIVWTIHKLCCEFFSKKKQEEKLFSKKKKEEKLSSKKKPDDKLPWTPEEEDYFLTTLRYREKKSH